MVLLWWVYGGSVVGTWCFRGGSTVRLCVVGVSIVPSWGHGRASVVDPSWLVHGTSMVPPRWVRDVAMVGLWCVHGAYLVDL